MAAKTVRYLAFSALALTASQAQAQDDWYYTPDYSAPVLEAEDVMETPDLVPSAANATGPETPEDVSLEYVSRPVVQPLPVQSGPARRIIPARQAPVSQPAAPQPQRRELGYSEAERDDWLARCRARFADDGLGGALIGGVLGGFAGNRIAGRGNRTIGTIAGAVAGAAAGTLIDKGEDRRRVADDCEAYLADYEAANTQPQYAYGQTYYAPVQPSAYGPAYAGYAGYAGYAYVPVMMVPVAIQPHNPAPKSRVLIEE